MLSKFLLLYAWGGHKFSVCGDFQETIPPLSFSLWQRAASLTAGQGSWETLGRQPLEQNSRTAASLDEKTRNKFSEVTHFERTALD